MTCTIARHDEIKGSPNSFAEHVIDIRKWPHAGLMIGECVDCGSSLSIPDIRPAASLRALEVVS